MLYDFQTEIIEQAKKLHVLDLSQVSLLTGKDFLDVAQGAELGKLVKIAYKKQIDQSITDRSILKSLVLAIE